MRSHRPGGSEHGEFHVEARGLEPSEEPLGLCTGRVGFRKVFEAGQSDPEALCGPTVKGRICVEDERPVPSPGG